MMVGHGLLLHGQMDGNLIPGVHLVKLVNTEEQTPLFADSRVLASMMNSLLYLTTVTVRPTAQLALSLVYTALG